MSTATMEPPTLSPNRTKMGVHEYLQKSGGIELIINFAGHTRNAEEAFDAARAYGNALRRKLEDTVEDEPMPEVTVKGSRVYLSLGEES